MPKRPPRIARGLSVPADLRAAKDTPHLAHETELGQLWLGRAEDVLASQGSGSVALVIADPPYAIAKEAWDEFESIDQYTEWCEQWLAEVQRLLEDTGAAYVCGFSEILAEVKARSARRFSGGCRWLIWYYRNKANLGRDWGRSHESILHLKKSKRTAIDVDAVRIPYNNHTTRYPNRVQAVSSQYGGGRRRDSWQPHPLGAKPRDVLEIPVLCNGMTEKTEHPTQKPEELIRRLVRASSKPGDRVLDPFCGSGTTAVVCESLGRQWIAVDSDPRYVGLARSRLQGGGLSDEPRPASPGGRARATKS